MSIPGFSAQASLYKTSNRYCSLTFDHASPQRTVLVPQIGGPGFEGFDNCLSDCADRHPDWTDKKCQKSCRASELGSGPSPQSGLDAFLSDTGINFWEAGCSAITGFPLGCKYVADVIRRQS